MDKKTAILALNSMPIMIFFVKYLLIIGDIHYGVTVVLLLPLCLYAYIFLFYRKYSDNKVLLLSLIYYILTIPTFNFVLYPGSILSFYFICFSLVMMGINAILLLIVNVSSVR